MGTQTAIADKIIDKKGNYLLAVKGNPYSVSWPSSC
jgi:predicted transposase YbfD/YdcC